MKVALYIRVSTDEQAKEGHSIGAQQDRLMDYVRSQAWEVAEVYIDDGYSAKDLDRPAIQRLLKDCESKKFDVVLVYRLDRLVRSVLDLYEVMNHLDKHGVMFKSATEVYDTTSAMGRFFITLVAAIAQWERENLGERVKMGMEKNFRKGGWNGGEPPYGYRLEEGKLVVYEPEAQIVKRIFDMYKTQGQREITRRLNKEGLRTRTGSFWHGYTVRYILENPVYYGKMRWNYRHFGGEKTGEEILIDGDHEPIISEEDFMTAATLTKKRYINREKTHVCFPFTGVLRCARCGHTLYGGERKQKRQNYRYYRCGGRFQRGICDMPIIAEDTIETLVLGHIDLLVNTEWYKEVAVTKEDIKYTPDYEVLERELKVIQRRKQKWQMAFANDAISLDDLRVRMKEENEKEEEIKRQMSHLPDKGKDTSLSPQEVITVARNIKDNWAHFEPEHRKLIICTLFSEITIDAIGEAVGGPGRRVACKIISAKTN
ncbi:recombinase family protein [Brevibacillus massiliensis]|uniref:recombinase family protein n=1 Tax=Brevibacillus massiliensis TaxID=1118054 RepID=UPI00030FBC2A|nr:recombinase family protein [Brevibacillus massiliensis]